MSGGINTHGALTAAAANGISGVPPAAAHQGTFLDFGRANGNSDQITSIFQRIDLSTDAASIDAARARVSFTGFGFGEASTVSGLNTGNDSAIIGISFFDAVSGGTQLGPTIWSNWASQNDVWTQLDINNSVVPVNARSVELSLSTRRTSGTATDAGSDNFSGSLTIDNFARETLRVDIGPNGTAVQSGWTQWEVGAVNANDQNNIIKNFTQFGGFTAELDDVDIRTRTGVNANNPLSSLLTHAVKNDATNNGGPGDLAFSLTLGDLDAGDYVMKLYMHDSSDADDFADIFLDTGSGFAQIANDLSQTTGSSFVDPETFEFLFTALAGTPVVIGFGSGSNNGSAAAEVFLNGFELTQVTPIAVQAVPEPAALVAWCLVGAIACVCAVRCRRAQRSLCL